MQLVTYHSHQPAGLLRAHLAYHRVYPEIEPVVCIDSTATNVAEARSICEDLSIAYFLCEPAKLPEQFSSLAADWTALLRTEQFLPKGTELLVLRAEVECDGATHVKGWLADHIGIGGTLEAIHEIEAPWDRLPLQAALLQGFGCDGHTVLLARRPEWLLHPEGDEFGRIVPIHHFYWHAECEVAIRARIAEDDAKGVDAWHWRRALQAIRTDGHGKKTIDVRDYIMDRQWIDGWFDYRTLYEAAAESVPNGGKMVEVGSWHGRSALFLADAVAARGKTAQITVVDLFENLGQHIPGEWSMEWRSRFEVNNRFAGGRCRPVQADSIQAAECEADASLDFVFIDADKHYNRVMADLQAWWRKLKPGGILAGHDYFDPDWPGVTAAVHDWAFRAGVQVHYTPPHAFWVKRPEGRRDKTTHTGRRLASFRVRRQPVVLSTREEHAYNPGMERDPETGHIIFAYRTTGPGWSQGKIWFCEIDLENARILTNPVAADLQPENLAYEDPRLFNFNGKLWLQYTQTDFRHRITNRIGVCPLGRQSRGGGGRFSNLASPSPRHTRRNRKKTGFSLNIKDS